LPTDRLSSLTPDRSSYDSTKILVRFQAQAVATALPGTLLGPEVPLVPGLRAVLLSPGVTVTAALAAYRANPQVVYAEPDYEVHADVVPNDPALPQQWGLGTIGARGAWNIDHGGKDPTVVAVIDTGVDYNHLDLYQNIWINQDEIPAAVKRQLVDVDGDGIISFVDLNNPINQGAGKITDVNGDGRIDAADILAPGKADGTGGWANGIAKDGDAEHVDDLVGWNFVSDTNQPLDDNSHGTHVAGILGARGNNGVGVTGVDWNVQIMPVKFLNAAGNGDVANAIAALSYAVTHGATISNDSWGSGANSLALFDTIASARIWGHLVVAAAGNNGTNNDVAPHFPANFSTVLDNVISVTATDAKDHLAAFSNFGRNTVSLAAPGVDILSTLPNNGYGVKSGTSMATPFVTGVAALLRDLHPDWSYRQLADQVLAAEDPLAALKAGTVGGGRLDAFAALDTDRQPIVQEQLNAQGNLVGWLASDFDAQRRLDNVTSQQWDGQGHLLKVISWDYDSAGINTRITEHDYDGQGDVLSKVVWYFDVPRHLTLIVGEQYNSQGRLTQRIRWEYGAGPLLRRITSWQLDDQGNYTSSLTWDFDVPGQPPRVTGRWFDAEGRLLKVLVY
jgi:subtilisin family serine protease